MRRILTLAQQYFALQHCHAARGQGEFNRQRLIWNFEARPTPPESAVSDPIVLRLFRYSDGRRSKAGSTATLGGSSPTSHLFNRSARAAVPVLAWTRMVVARISGGHHRSVDLPVARLLRALAADRRVVRRRTTPIGSRVS